MSFDANFENNNKKRLTTRESEDIPAPLRIVLMTLSALQLTNRSKACGLAMTLRHISTRKITKLSIQGLQNFKVH